VLKACENDPILIIDKAILSISVSLTDLWRTATRAIKPTRDQQMAANPERVKN
jgi:hypothetical protein